MNLSPVGVDVAAKHRQRGAPGATEVAEMKYLDDEQYVFREGDAATGLYVAVFFFMQRQLISGSCTPVADY